MLRNSPSFLWVGMNSRTIARYTPCGCPRNCQSSILCKWLLTRLAVSEQITLSSGKTLGTERAKTREGTWPLVVWWDVKEKPSHVVHQVITLRKARFCLWRESKTNSCWHEEASPNEAGSPAWRIRPSLIWVDVGEPPTSAKQVGVVH